LKRNIAVLSFLRKSFSFFFSKQQISIRGASSLTKC